MKAPWKTFAPIAENALPWAVLAILLVYTYVRFFGEPSSGFNIDSNGYVVRIYEQGNPDTPLHIGDRLVRVGPVTWVEFTSDYGLTLFRGISPGQEVQLVVERAGSQIPIQWKYPGSNAEQLADRAFSGFWLGYFFWLAGLLIGVHLRPKGEAWALAMAFCYLTAIGLVVGNPAMYHVWGSAFVLRVVIWFGVPVYLGFHWLWPLPFARPPASVTWAGYILATAASVAECLQLLPSDAYLVGFFTSVLGTLVLLAAHAIFQPAARSRLRWLLIVVFLAFVPLLGYPVLGSRVAPAVSASLASVGLPFIPLAYFSSLYRHRLGDLEVRINRVVSVYAFLVLQGLIVLPLITLVAFNVPGPATVLLVGAAVGIFSAIVTVVWFPAFQAFIERRLLGVPIPSERLIARYAARIVGCGSLSDVRSLLTAEVFPSLLVRQVAFLRIEAGRPQVVLALGVEPGDLPNEANLPTVAGMAGRLIPADHASKLPVAWIRLVIALKVGESLIGLWLFGRRDPDDVYSPSEIPIIQSLANQTAVTLSNIVHTERLRALYQADVNRHEEERLRLALKLHDTVLNHLATALMKLDVSSPMSEVQGTYEELANLVRGIATDLRPPMLAYGLKAAIEELAEEQMDRVGKSVQIPVDVHAGETRYPPQVELHAFRIVQESIENAVRHAEATSIAINGRLEPERFEIHVQDDGTGFEAPFGMALETLIAQKHFGLAGLAERADLIGAQFRIDTAPGHGTHVSLTWARPPRQV